MAVNICLSPTRILSRIPSYFQLIYPTADVCKFQRLVYFFIYFFSKGLQGDPTLEGVSHIIIDEVHERGVLADFLLIILKDLLPQRPDIRVILMSATVNSETFSHYFGGCATLLIPGFAFPVEQLFLEDVYQLTKYAPSRSGPQQQRAGSAHSFPRKGGGSSSSPTTGGGPARVRGAAGAAGGGKGAQQQQESHMVAPEDVAKYSSRTLQLLRDVNQATIDYGLLEATLLFIVKGDRSAAEGLGVKDLPVDGAVLVFLPGINEITKLSDRLRTNGAFRSLLVVPLHSSLSSRDQKLIFAPPPSGKRKVVLATNIAETSITIADVTVVIDT